jgi:hypothetical protein
MKMSKRSVVVVARRPEQTNIFPGNSSGYDISPGFGPTIRAEAQPVEIVSPRTLTKILKLMRNFEFIHSFPPIAL